MPTEPSRALSLPVAARVLVVRLSALGDVLFALETVASAKRERPDLRIDFLVEDRFAGILAGHPQIESVRTLPRRGRRRWLGALRALRRERYDAVLDLHGLLKSALPLLVIRSPLKLGFAPPGAREGAHLAVDVAVPLPDPLPHRAERGLFLLRALGLSGAAAPAVLGMPPEPAPCWAGGARPRVVLHPGSSAFAAFKRWPAERHAALARALLAAGCEVAVSFGPGEEELAQRVAAGSPAKLIDGRTLGLIGLAAAFRDADLVVAADTGPLHIAAAAGTSVVALFGPKDPAWYGPRATRSRVLFHDVPCRPCRRRDCVSPQCVLGLDVETVCTAVRSMLDCAGRA